jgi:hypothetical protein
VEEKGIMKSLIVEQKAPGWARFIIALFTIVASAGLVNAHAQSFTISPASLAIDFGTMSVNTCTQGLDVTVTNTGTLNVPIQSYSMSPSPALTAPFKLVNGWAPEQLPAGSQIIYTIKFCPLAAQTYNGTFTLNITGFSPYVITLTGVGTATGAVSSLSVNALNFGSVPIGSTSAPQPVTITNTGTTTMNLTSLWTDPPYYLTGYTGKTQINAGKSITYQIYFQPTQPGSYPSDIFFQYDVVPDNGFTVNGTGTATTAFGMSSFTQLPAATQGAAYYAQLAANGGTLPLSWSLASGSTLPSGLTLATNGTINGTVSSSVNLATYPFTAQVSDSSSPPKTVTGAFTLAVDTPTGANCNDIIYYNSTNQPLVPLNDLGTGNFFGEEGGLYPNGSNVRPADHDADGVKLADGIVPLDSNGNPNPNGQYVLLTVGMSVAHIDSEGLISRAATEPTVNPHLVIVDGAQPRGDADLFADPNNAFWNPIFSDFLPNSGVTPAQVVAAWVLDDNPKPQGGFPATMQTLQANFDSIAQNLHSKFPNLQIAYFLTRNYGGYSNGIGSSPDPEPTSYEVGWGPKWSIQDQLDGLPSMNYNPANGPVMAPWVAWGPYNWANGLLPRSDGLTWSCQDFQPDGHHPSQYTGKWKDANISINYLKTDDTARPWFLQPSALVITSPTSLNFGNQSVGVKSSPMNLTVTNNQGLVLNFPSSPTIGGTNPGDFQIQTNTCGNSLIVGGTCTISVTFMPAAIGARSATLNIIDDLPNSPLTIALSGTGVNSSSPAVQLTPPSLTFASQLLTTTSASQPITVKNTGTGTLNVTAITASGDYSETDTCVGNGIPANGTCTINVTFTPTTAGTISGAITLVDNALNTPQAAPVTGTGTYPVTVTPSLLSFGSQAVGTTSAPKTITVTNNQSVAISLGYSASGDYSVVPGGSAPCGSSLNGKTRCSLNVTFSPSYNGAIKGSVAITYNAAFSPQDVAVSGTGTGGHPVPLIFNPTTGGFGNQVIATTSATKAITVKNTSASDVNITSYSASGNFTAAAGSKPCSGVLAPNGTCNILVSFSPSVPAAITGVLSVYDNSGVSPQMMVLTGTGVLPVTAAPASLAFAPQSVGTTSSPQIVTLTNNSTTLVNISSIVASGDFLYVPAGTTPCGSSLAKGASCTIGVEFSPSSTGAITGALTVSDNAPYSPQLVALSGTGQ